MAYCTSSFVAPWFGRSHSSGDIKNGYHHFKAADHKIGSPPGTGSRGCNVNALLCSQVKVNNGVADGGGECLGMSLSVRPFSDPRFSSCSLRPYALAEELAWIHVRNGRSALIRGHDT